MRVVARVLEMHCASMGIETASPDGYALAEILVAAMRNNPMSEIELASFVHRLTSHVTVDALAFTIH
jgi:hypothetical protein